MSLNVLRDVRMLNSTDPQDLERSIRRGKHRERVYFAVMKGGTLTIREIADITGLSPYQVEGHLFGDGRRFAYHLSLVTLGVVARAHRRYARAVRPTATGLRVAEQVRARRRLSPVPPGSQAWDT